jgi:hypothetical protein
MDNQPDLFTLVEAQSLNNEINRLKDLNQRLVAAAKELGYADDVHEWDDAWSKMCKIMKECKEVGETLQTVS